MFGVSDAMLRGRLWRKILVVREKTTQVCQLNSVNGFALDSLTLPSKAMAK